MKNLSIQGKPLPIRHKVCSLAACLALFAASGCGELGQTSARSAQRQERPAGAERAKVRFVAAGRIENGLRDPFAPLNMPQTRRHGDATAESAMNFKLTGIIRQGDNRLAIIEYNGGSNLCCVNDRVGSYAVVAIEDEVVSLDNGVAVIALRLRR